MAVPSLWLLRLLEAGLFPGSFSLPLHVVPSQSVPSQGSCSNALFSFMSDYEGQALFCTAAAPYIIRNNEKKIKGDCVPYCQFTVIVGHW